MPRASACLAAVLLPTILAASAPAFAADCPSGKVMADAIKPGPMAPRGVSDDVLSSIDLAMKSQALEGNLFRLRRLVVQPGGIVPWHSHGERPAHIYIVSGTITEHRLNCAVPIVHKAGDAIAEFGADHSHWWQNTGKKPAVLISADILPPAMKDDHTM